MTSVHAMQNQTKRWLAVADVENRDSISMRQPSLNQKHRTTILKSKTLEIAIVKKDKS
jgi:hypothetical protein